MNILLTGSAGFIGFHLAKKLLDENINIIGIDNMNDYYDVFLKKSRNDILKKYKNYKFYEIDISDKNNLEKIFKENKIDLVCNLAAQAGVRYSLENPDAYVQSNLVGFVNILECMRHNHIKNLIYASSSSVYGNTKETPFSVDNDVDNPVSLYAATKRSNEIIAFTYYNLFKIKSIGLRFFTVYGAFGRPDMAYFKFTKSILEGKGIDVYNNGDLERDFTYIDDIVDGILCCIQKFDKFEKEIFNLGNNKPVRLLYFIEILEKLLGKKAKKNFLGMQKGDVYATYADIYKSIKLLSYTPKTSIEKGLGKFIKWYKEYYRV